MRVIPAKNLRIFTFRCILGRSRIENVQNFIKFYSSTSEKLERVDYNVNTRPRALRVMRRYSNVRLFSKLSTHKKPNHNANTMMEDEELVHEYVQGESNLLVNVKEFLKDRCKCSRGPKDGPCSSQFTEKEVLANLNNCLELTAKELDLVILANLQAVSRSPRGNFLFQSKPICR